VLCVAIESETSWHHARIADDQWHVERDVIDAMMIKIAIVIVESLAVVGSDHHDGIIGQTLVL